MPMFTLHRKYTMRTTKGFVIRFAKGEPTWVPDAVVHDAVAIGAQPVDNDVDVLGEEEKPEVILSPLQRKEKLLAAFRVMKDRNERTDFTASGLPNAKKLFDLTGFEVHSKERDDAWMEFTQSELQEDADE